MSVHCYPIVLYIVKRLRRIIYTALSHLTRLKNMETATIIFIVYFTPFLFTLLPMI